MVQMVKTCLLKQQPVGLSYSSFYVYFLLFLKITTVILTSNVLYYIYFLFNLQNSHCILLSWNISYNNVWPGVFVQNDIYLNISF